MEITPMESEQNKILEALKTAIEKEKADKECYLNAVLKSDNEAGRKLLQSLALEEDTHRQKLEEIYLAIQKKMAWPAVYFPLDKSKKLMDLLTGVCETSGVYLKTSTIELGIINTAIKKEKESYDFYKSQSQNASDKAERNFYEAIADEEREHELILVHYNEYLTDPVDWFTRVEHHSMDG
jgi:rubrerythrin